MGMEYIPMDVNNNLNKNNKNTKSKKIKKGILIGTLILCGSGGIAKCSLNKYNENHIEYEIDEAKNYKIKSVPYDSIKKYNLVEIINMKNEHQLLILKAKNSIPCIKYIDIFSGECVFTSDDKNIKIIKSDKISNYLITYNEVKSEYTDEDLRRILNEIEADYIFEKDKVKTK